MSASRGLDLEDYRRAVAGTRVPSRAWESAGTASDPVVIVSVDSHVGPPLEHYREYCPKAFLEEFDEFARAHVQSQMRSAAEWTAEMQAHAAADAAASRDGMAPSEDNTVLAISVIVADPSINYDSPTRLSRMDEDGIAAEVIYHGGEDFVPVPFVGLGREELTPVAELSGLGSDPWKRGARGAELAAAGMRMYNRWLGDYCSEAPGRYLGLALLPMWDVELAVREVEFAREAGLVGVNFPAPRPGLTSYNDLAWEPLWSACESMNMTLNTHTASAGRTVQLGAITGVNAAGPRFMDLGYTSRRGIAMMIYGLVFDRHPGLKMLMTETAAGWVRGYLRDLDSMQWGLSNAITAPMRRKPSEYFWDHVFIGASFMSNDEALTAVADGVVSNVLWGRDYPHFEGTWPYTKWSLRKTMEGIPEDAARQLLGLNAIDVFRLDSAAVHAVAGKVGPSIDELMTPLTPDELPAGRGFTSGFRAPGQAVI